MIVNEELGLVWKESFIAPKLATISEFYESD
jgi:hypothetical protein